MPDDEAVNVTSPTASQGRPARGSLKVYIGSAAGTGKTYRMLNDAQQLRRDGVDIAIGLVETHGRADTDAQIGDLEVIPRARISYRSVELEEMDLPAIVARAPDTVIVDELPHTNVPGSRNAKRWQDVLELQDRGINVITALNVQHLESLRSVLQQILGVTVRETVPDWVVNSADQVINLDIPAADLRRRVQDGKIYPNDKIGSALANFFTTANLDTLRELALREVANTVDRGRDADPATHGNGNRAVERLLVAMSSDPDRTAVLLRKASRIAGRLNRDWYGVYVQTRDEHATHIAAELQRKLVDNFQLAQSLGAEVVTLKSDDVASTLLQFARAHHVTLLLAGQSRHSRLRNLFRVSVLSQLGRNVDGIDLLIVAAS